MTITTELRQAYNFHRSQFYHWKAEWRGTMPAKTALDYARGDIANGKARYTGSPWAKPCGNGAMSERGAQWIERPADMGLRFVGYCDKIRDSIGHTGWYTDCYNEESIRGVVYQLPGRDGKARFVAGHDNPNNGAADAGGPAFVDFSEIYEESCVGFNYDGSTYASDLDACRDAAGAADEFTRIEAEKEKEYSTAWQAGARYADAIQERAEIKTELRALLVERRNLKAQASAATVAICSAVESQARDMLATIAKAADKAGKLASGDMPELYFHDGDKRLRDAFNEGAGRDVLPI